MGNITTEQNSEFYLGFLKVVTFLMKLVLIAVVASVMLKGVGVF